MGEYLIRRTDGEWFDIPQGKKADAYRPIASPSERIEGEGTWRIRCEGVEIGFSFEDPGIQIWFEGDLPESTEDRIADEIRQSIERVTGQMGRVVPV